MNFKILIIFIIIISISGCVSSQKENPNQVIDQKEIKEDTINVNANKINVTQPNGRIQHFYMFNVKGYTCFYSDGSGFATGGYSIPSPLSCIKDVQIVV